MEELVTPEEIAETLKLDRRTIIRWLQEGRLTGFKVGNRWRVEREVFQHFLEGLKNK